MAQYPNVNYTRPGNVDAACGLHPPLLHIPGCLSGRPSDFFSPAPRYWILSFFLSSLVVLKITQTGTASKTGQYAHLHTGGEGEEAQVASSARINVKKTKATSRILAWIVSLMTSLDISLFNAVSFFSLDRRRPERTLQEHILTGGLSGGRRGGPCAFAGSSLLRGTPAPFGTTLTL